MDLHETINYCIFICNTNELVVLFHCTFLKLKNMTMISNSYVTIILLIFVLFLFSNIYADQEQDSTDDGCNYVPYVIIFIILIVLVVLGLLILYYRYGKKIGQINQSNTMMNHEDGNYGSKSKISKVSMVNNKDDISYHSVSKKEKSTRYVESPSKKTTKTRMKPARRQSGESGFSRRTGTTQKIESYQKFKKRAVIKVISEDKRKVSENKRKASKTQRNLKRSRVKIPRATSSQNKITKDGSRLSKKQQRKKSVNKKRPERKESPVGKVGSRTMLYNDGISFYKQILKSIHSVKSVSQYFADGARK